MRTVEEIKAEIAEKQACPPNTSIPWVQKAARQYITMLEEELRSALTADIPLDRLEAICAAEKDGRLVTLDGKPMPTVRGNDEYDTDAYCPYCGETVSGYWGVDDTVPEICQCPNCGGYIDVYAISITRA